MCDVKSYVTATREVEIKHVKFQKKEKERNELKREHIHPLKRDSNKGSCEWGVRGTCQLYTFCVIFL